MPKPTKKSTATMTTHSTLTDLSRQVIVDLMELSESEDDMDICINLVDPSEETECVLNGSFGPIKLIAPHVQINGVNPYGIYTTKSHVVIEATVNSKLNSKMGFRKFPRFYRKDTS